MNAGRYVGVAQSNDIGDDEFTQEFAALGSDFKYLSTQARELERTIAANAAEILGI